MTPPPAPTGDEPKLIIDTDWKAQAQAEKERLSATAKPAAGPGATPGADEGEQGPIGFQDLVSMLTTQALSYMGAYPDPRTGKAMIALDYAKLHIDMLGVLEEKTKGNLNEQEQTLITRTVAELRVEFVELVKAVDKAVAEGKIKPGQVGMGGPGGGGGAGGGGGGGGPGITMAQPGQSFGGIIGG